MATVFLTGTAQSMIVKTSIGNLAIIRFDANESSSQVNNGDNIKNYDAPCPPFSSFAMKDRSTEMITPLNIGDQLTIGDLYIRRTSTKGFSFGNNTSTGTFSVPDPSSDSIYACLFKVVVFSDGVSVATITAISGTYRYLIDNISYDSIFPYITTIAGYGANIDMGVSDFGKSIGNDLLNNILPTDPYTGAGDSDTGGGGGTFDGSSDPVPVPALPSVGATNTGFISLFVPTQAQLKQVADYLWSPFLDISTFKKIFENPMDCILGLSVVPVSVPTSGNAQITVGNVELSGISLPLASQQYVEVDCGSIPFTDKFFGSYLDQDPYTKMALFVPYSGVHSVNADDIMGKTVNLKYHVDILTGSIVAFLSCGDSVLYEFNGACASNIPVNSMNYASTIENAIRIGVNIGTTVATAGAAAPLTGANKAARETARTFGRAVNMTGSTAEGILSLKPNIDRAGSLGGTTGLMGNQIPYFIITRPRLCKPANQNTFKGYPSFIQVTISDLIGEGYTEFDTVVLAGLYLTDGEKEELKQILESGVYL